MNARMNATVTNGEWGVSCCTGGDPGAVLSIYRYRVAGRDLSPLRTGALYGTLNDRVYPSSDEAFAAALAFGYLTRAGRNTGRWNGFVMSRAARRRGITTTNRSYLESQAEHTGERCGVCQRPGKRRWFVAGKTSEWQCPGCGHFKCTD